MKKGIVAILLLFYLHSTSQAPLSKITQRIFLGDVTATVDEPVPAKRYKETIVVLFALPNGNTTAQTMGKKITPGDDWHYDIQHIKAQTAFLRNALPSKRIIVIYLENKMKSWPAWKKAHAAFKSEIPAIIDSLWRSFPGKNITLQLCAHSGGGAFLFGYLDGIEAVPSYLKRISFIDANYGYDSSYAPKLVDWLKGVKNARLNVFAYNDSVALYNGKPVVSATGGTWYKSGEMRKDFSPHFPLQEEKTDSIIIIYKSPHLAFYLKPNADRGIYHTQQVELNGFIHSVLAGTKLDSKAYSYYGKRAYQELISP
ncbi:MAG: hypothetical protein JWP88_2142 [Flaviaesturariibacter sp.]|nr:hypothetical protein [Flaviaesturariibacter sp.]